MINLINRWFYRPSVRARSQNSMACLRLMFAALRCDDDGMRRELHMRAVIYDNAAEWLLIRKYDACEAARRLRIMRAYRRRLNEMKGKAE
jgi:hypothetical protein